MSDHADTIRRDYTRVCRCEWSSDDETVLDTNPDCVIHGSKPDPLDALLAERQQLQEERDELRAQLAQFNATEDAWREAVAERQQAIDALRQIAHYDLTKPGPPVILLQNAARTALVKLGEQP